MYLVLVVLWIIFNGQFTVEILIFGLGISAVVYWFMCKFLDFSVAKDLLMLRELILFVWYAENLLVEILKANAQTFRILMSNRYEPEPVIVRFKTDLETRSARILLANSITLTPGTITVSLEDNEYLVHCLDKELAEGIEDSSFVKILRRMEEVRARTRKS
ncbi:MAG: Na+/H+ antiporter subunit E [Lachnospiraceae bacterium]|nr:Na+/H+ antiporter subunit E [Lachnospiraceae bacterium]